MNISKYLPEIPEETKSAVAADTQCLGSDGLKLLGVYVASAGDLFSGACLVGAGILIDMSGTIYDIPQGAFYRNLPGISQYHDAIEHFGEKLGDMPFWLERKWLESIQEDEMRRYEVNPDVWKLS